MHGWFAAHGYAAIRVDMRGSGESDGHLADEYLTQELADACGVIDWLSRQGRSDRPATSAHADPGPRRQVLPRER